MKIIKKLMEFLAYKHSNYAPLLIIKRDADMSRMKDDTDIKEYATIEEAISDLENDPNVSAYKIEKLRLSLNKLKNKTSIKIKNGEIIK